MNRFQVFSGPNVTLLQLLSAKDARVQRRASLCVPAGGCVICFTLNIPGPIKQFPLAQMAFEEGLDGIRRTLGCNPLTVQTFYPDTGCEAFLVYELSPETIKKKVIAFESEHPLGRLFDFDVFDSAGSSISRAALSFPARRCLICGNIAKVCGRSRAHPLDELQDAVAAMLTDFFASHAAQQCGDCAEKALLSELSTTPKPGLVDRNNCGSHTDMDYSLFIASIQTLGPWFRKFFLTGARLCDGTPEALFSALRTVGADAEDSMFAATGGINTHKGFIFLSAVFCGALGALYARSFQPVRLCDALTLCGEIGRCSLSDFADGQDFPKTNGVTCYQNYGISGVRGEAADGFPAVIKVGLPALKQWLCKGCSLNDAAAAALLAIIASTQDTNMIKRGSVERAEQRRKEASELYASLTNNNLASVLAALDSSYISENLSPGGCADILAVSLMFFFAKQSRLLDF